MKHSIKFILLLFSTTFLTYGQTIELEPYATNFERPTDITNAGDDRLFVTEQSGLITIVTAQNSKQSEPFLDITDRVYSDPELNEIGLLGLAFHPNYSENGKFYVNYTRRMNQDEAETVISEFQRSNESSADPSTEKILLTYLQPALNHNGGALAFGPDGKLYIGSGDGGGANDEFNHGQNINSVFGTILRLDVDIAAPYIPSDNPFVGIEGSDEIYAYGLRNPWRISFDSQNGNLWIADVGDNNNLSLFMEEVNKVSIGSNTETALNFGWPCYEGNDQNPNPEKSNQCSGNSGLTFPITTYVRENVGETNRCSITGGYVYRGTEYPALQGKYVYGDYCSSEIFTVNATDGSNFTATRPIDEFLGIGTFGESNTNELFVAGNASGIVYKVVDADALGVNDFQSSGFTISQDMVAKTITVAGKQATNFKTFDVYNLTGQKVLDLTQRKLSNSTYSLSGLNVGVYILEATHTNNQIISEKIVIN